MEGLLSEKKLFILDMDGTIYLDETPIDGAREFIAYAKAKGKRIIYFTNNASKSIEMYYESLTAWADVSEGRLYHPPTLPSTLNRNHKNQKVYLVGTPALENFTTAE